MYRIWFIWNYSFRNSVLKLFQLLTFYPKLDILYSLGKWNKMFSLGSFQGTVFSFRKKGTDFLDIKKFPFHGSGTTVNYRFLGPLEHCNTFHGRKISLRYQWHCITVYNNVAFLVNIIFILWYILWYIIFDIMIDYVIFNMNI